MVNSVQPFERASKSDLLTVLTVYELYRHLPEITNYDNPSACVKLDELLFFSFLL